MPSIDLNEKNVLVVGGSGELGSRIAGEMLRRGARVMLAARDADRLEDLARRLGPNVLHTSFDLRRDDPERIIEEILQRLGCLDGIVNAAGVVAFGPLETLTDQALNDLVAVNFTGPLRLTRAALPHLEGGFLVNLTGVVAEQPVGGMAVYSAVKAGLSGATRALARELRSRRIQVMDARPPHTETGLARRPIEGQSPPLPTGLDPDRVAARIVDGLVAGQRELAAADITP